MTVELGLGIEEMRPAQVRLELQENPRGTIRLVGIHTAKPLNVQTLARFEVDEAEGGSIACELIPLGSSAMAHAFGVVPGCVMPIKISGSEPTRGLSPERPSGGPGIRISHSDAISMIDLLREGRVDSVIAGVQTLIDNRKAEVEADLKGGGFDEWIKSYCGEQKPESMRFAVTEMRRAFEAGRFGVIGHPPPDVVRLVVAAREVAFGGILDLVRNAADADLETAMRDLDQASEAFASRVRWDDEPSDEEAGPEPVVHHGTINIDGQDHAIRLEIHQTEGGVFDGEGHEIISLYGVNDAEPMSSEDHARFAEHLAETLRERFPGATVLTGQPIDMTGLRASFAVVDDPHSSAAMAPEGMATFDTLDPGFDPAQAVLINGSIYAPLAGVISAIVVARESAVFDDNGPKEYARLGMVDPVYRLACNVWKHGRDHLRTVAIQALKAHFAFCARCGDRPVVVNLDGDDLCHACADKWAKAEGQAEQDRQRDEAEHREEGDDES